MIPSLSTGIVGSRFVSQNEIDTAKARRDEQWRAAYARFYSFMLFVAPSYVERLNYLSCRLGQEPPPQPVEDSYDGRSLAEVSTWNQTMSVLEDRVY